MGPCYAMWKVMSRLQLQWLYLLVNKITLMCATEISLLSKMKWNGSGAWLLVMLRPMFTFRPIAGADPLIVIYFVLPRMVPTAEPTCVVRNEWWGEEGAVVEPTVSKRGDKWQSHRRWQQGLHWGHGGVNWDGCEDGHGWHSWHGWQTNWQVWHRTHSYMEETHKKNQSFCNFFKCIIISFWRK